MSQDFYRSSLIRRSKEDINDISAHEALAAINDRVGVKTEFDFDCDWVEVFNWSDQGFKPEDVVYIVKAIEGENDGADWEMVGRLKDGRWFYIHAGCDYTGWD